MLHLQTSQKCHILIAKIIIHASLSGGIGSACSLVLDTLLLLYMSLLAWLKCMYWCWNNCNATVVLTSLSPFWGILPLTSLSPFWGILPPLDRHMATVLRIWFQLYVCIFVTAKVSFVTCLLKSIAKAFLLFVMLPKMLVGCRKSWIDHYRFLSFQ